MFHHPNNKSTPELRAKNRLQPTAPPDRKTKQAFAAIAAAMAAIAVVGFLA